MSKTTPALPEIKSSIDDYLRRHHPDICRHWFHEITVASVASGCVALRIPERVHRQYLQRSCLAAFTEAAQAATGKLVAVKFVGDPNELQSGSAPHQESAPLLGELEEQLPLSPDYTFESFVVGPGNRLVHAAAIAVGSNPGRAYNPLFIHGGVGLGKTHVLQAICQVILRQRSESRIGYLSCQSFAEIFMACVKAGRMQDFRHRFRNLDMLVVDDIHFLSKREQSQEEFFHTFNSLYQIGKQIILSSDASPNDIPDLEERLVSRFNCGLVARMDRPCYETRVAILKSKAAMVGANVPEEICSYIAARVDTNIRELEGCLTKVRCFALANNRPIDLDLTKEALVDDSFGLSSSARPSIQTIAEAVTRYYEIRLADLLSKRRHQSISVPRQMCMWLARKHTRYSLEEIGGYFGGRDHTTVLHAVRNIATRKESDPDIASAVSRIESAFTHPNAE
jgi:chromosomal replication initiator protein